MRGCGLALTSAVFFMAACGNNGGPDGTAGETPSTAPPIGINMESPVENPFCYFVADTGAPLPVTGPEARYVFVTEVGETVYSGYAKLGGEVRKLTEVETGFGAGMETRRYVDDETGVELEVILLDERTAETKTRYRGSVRVIYPVEGEAVKFYGECRHDSVTE